MSWYSQAYGTGFAQPMGLYNPVAENKNTFTNK